MDDIMKAIADKIGEVLGDKGETSGRPGRIETFMEKESKEPEHQKSFADGSLQEFAQEEAKEPEHKKSLQEDKDLKEWGKEEDQEDMLKDCVQVVDDNVIIKGCEFGNVDNFISYLKKAQSSDSSIGLGKGGVIIEVDTSNLDKGNDGNSSNDETLKDVITSN